MVVALGGGGGLCYIGATSGIKASLSLLEIHYSRRMNLSKNSFIVL